MTPLDRWLVRAGAGALMVIALYLFGSVVVDVALWRRDVTVAVQQLLNAANRPAPAPPSVAPAPAAPAAPTPKGGK